MKKCILTGALLILACVNLTAGEWVTYKSADYGFEMLVPKGTKVKEQEKEGGWGKLVAKHGADMVVAYAKLGKESSAEDIEAFGLKVVKIPEDKWELLDEGKNNKGWKWYKTYVAKKGKKVYFVGYGSGPKGSYLMFLRTTAKELKANEKDYQNWYESIKLN